MAVNIVISTKEVMRSVQWIRISYRCVWAMQDDYNHKVVNRSRWNCLKQASRRDHVRNLDILKDLAIDKDIIDILQIRKLTYFGHVIRMAPRRYPHVSLHGYIHGQRPRGRPQKKWMDNIREDCAEMDMSLIQASRLAWDRAQWRNTIRNKGCQRAKTTSSSSPGH